MPLPMGLDPGHSGVAPAQSHVLEGPVVGAGILVIVVAFVVLMYRRLLGGR
jgi:hypothetical protein